MSEVFTVGQKHIVITFAFLVFLAIHSLVQPYKKPKHNYIETLYLVNLVIISMIVLSFLTFINPTILSKIGLVTLFLAGFVLVHLPYMVWVACLFWKRKCCQQCRAAWCKKCKRSSTESVQETKAPAVEMLPSEVYLDMSEVEKSIQLA